VRMMRRTGWYRFAEDESVAALSVPYAGGDLEMLVLLPKRMDRLGELEQSLDSRRLDDLCGRLAGREVQLSLPKFHMESQFELSAALKQMGIATAFSPSADFSGIYGMPGDLRITGVVHKAYVDVDEEGTEAAGATGVIVGAAFGSKSTDFNADHPFLFLIRDVKAGTILFMGRVEEPVTP